MSGSDSYSRLLTILRAGGRLPQQAIDSVLASSGRSSRDLVHDCFVGPATGTPTTCKACGGEIGPYTSHRRGGCQVRYLRCRDCGLKPENNKQVVPAAIVTPRRKRPK